MPGGAPLFYGAFQDEIYFKSGNHCIDEPEICQHNMRNIWLHTSK